ncbi:hypothetical protein DSECCO2_510470 [anaerobic digester metagenome]
MQLLNFLLQIALFVPHRMAECVIIGLSDFTQHPVEIAAVDNRFAVRTNAGLAFNFRQCSTTLRAIRIFVNITSSITRLLNESPVFNKRFISS